MEEHRLKPMVTYDPQLFKDIFQNTEGLRKKLASEVNPERFGLEYKDILSWFNVKFIFVFNKYVNEMPKDRLKGFIINSLKTYKNKLLRYSYQDKYVNNPIELVETYEMYENIQEVDLSERQGYLLDITYRYMKLELSDDAYQVFDIDLNPPPFILEKMKHLDKINKIPPVLIAEYLGYGTSISAERYITKLRQEIREVLKGAKEVLPKLA